MATKGLRFLALLRGINVGGKNIIPKDALKRCFEDCGFHNVRTYIQSGNVLFRSRKTAAQQLTRAVETGLSKRFSYDAQAIVISHKQYRAAVQAAPGGWGSDDTWKHNALFTMTGVKPKQIMAQLPEPKAEFEQVTVGPGVIFWSISKEHQTKTTLMTLAKSPAYQQVTVRNHNTVFKLLELFESV